jgi:hypothetical protein
MTAQEYIVATLEKLAEPTSLESISSTALEDAIFAKVMSKKFRKLKADESAVRTTKNAIHLAVSNNQPITVSYLFGGNKLWRFEEAPEIDWAELFSLIYFLQWMKSITNVYGPGARLDYYSEDVAVEVLNNVTRQETEMYSKTFRDMLEWIKPYIPRNVSITYRRYGEEYKDYDDYLRELEAAKALVLQENNGQLPTLSETQKLATELNVRLLPGQVEDPQWREKVELTHKALEKTDTIENSYFSDVSLILACPTIYEGWIATGSTKKSYAKFWAGVGALEASGNDFNEVVLTPKQLENAKFEWQTIKLSGLSGKNFSRIRVLR